MTLLRAALLTLMLVAMGREGLLALSDLTGLDCRAGVYDFRNPDHTMIYSQGKKDRLIWSVTVKWKNGSPEWVMLSESGVEI